MIEICGATRTYASTRALDGVSFCVPDGAVTGFVGPNGAGKSTLMRVATGLELPDSGSVVVDGTPLGGRPAGQVKVGALLEAGWVLPRRTARDHVRLVAIALGLPASRAEQVLAFTGLTEVAHHPIGSFSLGMKQRLGIATAVLSEPQTLLLDEPANGLDPDGVAWLRRFVRELAGQGKAVLISSHLLSELAQTVDRIVMIGRGRVLHEGPLGDLLVADRSVSFASCDDDASLAVRCREAGAEVVRLPDGRLRIAGLTVIEVSRLARDHDLLLTHLSAAMASLEERFAAITEQHVDYRAGLHPAAAR